MSIVTVRTFYPEWAARELAAIRADTGGELLIQNIFDIQEHVERRAAMTSELESIAQKLSSRKLGDRRRSKYESRVAEIKRALLIPDEKDYVYKIGEY